jgi:hypothetical protein
VDELSGTSRISKIGEGTFKEVFKCRDMVIAVMPIEGMQVMNGEPQKMAGEVLGEVLASQDVSQLRLATPSCGCISGSLLNFSGLSRMCKSCFQLVIPMQHGLYEAVNRTSVGGITMSPNYHIFGIWAK